MVEIGYVFSIMIKFNHYTNTRHRNIKNPKFGSVELPNFGFNYANIRNKAIFILVAYTIINYQVFNL